MVHVLFIEQYKTIQSRYATCHNDSETNRKQEGLSTQQQKKQTEVLIKKHVSDDFCRILGTLKNNMRWE